MARLRADSSNNSWATHETGLDGAPFWKHFQLAEKSGETSNAIFESLSQWEAVLKAENIAFDPPPHAEGAQENPGLEL